MSIQRFRRVLPLLSATLLASLYGSPVVAAAKAVPPAPRVVSATTIPRATGATLGWVLAAEAGDGTVYTVGRGAKAVTVWAAPTSGKPRLLATLPGLGPVTLMTVAAGWVYLASSETVVAIGRSSGRVADRWTLTGAHLGLTQIAAGDGRLWALLTTTDPLLMDKAQSTLLELDPTSGAHVLQRSSLPGVWSIAAGPHSVYYATAGGRLTELSDDGRLRSAPSNLSPDLGEGGSDALQVIGLSRGRLITKFDYGEGVGAALFGYDQKSLRGPLSKAPFISMSAVADTHDGLLELDTDYADDCPELHACLHWYSLKSGYDSAPLVLPADTEVSDPLGPDPALVVGGAHRLTVLRLGNQRRADQ